MTKETIRKKSVGVDVHIAPHSNGMTKNQNGKKYASYEDYLNKKEMLILPEGWTETTTPTTWTKADGTINDNVIAITDGTNTIPLPNGFKVSTTDGEDSISEGLVITYDNDLKDEMNNIYDLRRNAYEWTAEAYSTNDRVRRGDHCGNSSYSVSNRNSVYPSLSSTVSSSRAALYIK